MRRIVPTIAMVVLATGLVSAQKPAEKRNDTPFQSPEIFEAEQFPYSTRIASVAGIGIVVLEPTIGADGRVESVEVIRSTPGMEAGAIQSVKTWKFHPAKIHGKPVRSRATVAVVFNQGYNVPPEFSLPPLTERTEQEEERKNDREEDENGDRLINFSPSLPAGVVIPAYPVMSAMTTTVVLQVKLDSEGGVNSVVPLHDVAAFAPKAIDAVREWKFSPATLENQPVPSTVTIAVFFTPATSSY